MRGTQALPQNGSAQLRSGGAAPAPIRDRRAALAIRQNGRVERQDGGGGEGAGVDQQLAQEPARGRCPEGVARTEGQPQAHIARHRVGPAEGVSYAIDNLFSGNHAGPDTQLDPNGRHECWADPKLCRAGRPAPT
jgi:hypothetical protein